MDDGPTEGLDPFQRLRQIVDREIGQGERISRPTPSLVYPDRGGFRPRLPARTLSFTTGLERAPQQFGPEATGALGVVSREFDQSNGGLGGGFRGLMRLIGRL